MQEDANLNGIGDACEGVDQGVGLQSVVVAPQTFNRFVGDKRYELSNHLGNVLSVVSDRKLFQNPLGFTTFAPDVLSYSDYYPFGMLVPNRHKSFDGYRYGFQGQEMDNELKGEGNSLNYTFRMHDPRVGRFFARDPLESDYPFYSPYQFSGNRVIDMVELEGLEPSKTKTFGTYFMSFLFPPAKADTPALMIIPNAKYVSGAVAVGQLAIVTGGVSGAGSTFFARMLELGTRRAVIGGTTGAVVNGSLSLIDGDKPFDVFKNSVGGFVSGAIISTGGVSATSLLANGAVGEGLSDLTQQYIEMAKGDRGDLSYSNILKSAGVGAAANLVSSKLLKFIDGAITEKTNQIYAKIDTKAFRDAVSDNISKKYPNIKTSGKQFKSLVNDALREYRTLTAKQANQLQISFEKLLDVSGEKIQGIIKDNIGESKKK